MITYIPVDVWAALHDESLKPIHVLWQITYWYARRKQNPKKME